MVEKMKHGDVLTHCRIYALIYCVEEPMLEINIMHMLKTDIIYIATDIC